AWGDPPYPDGAPGDGAAPGPTTPTSWLTIPAPSRPSSGCAPETWCSTATQAVGFTPTTSATPPSSATLRSGLWGPPASPLSPSRPAGPGTVAGTSSCARSRADRTLSPGEGFTAGRLSRPSET